MNDIATMEPGPEMDAAVAEALGWTNEKSGVSLSEGMAVFALETWRAQDGNERWVEIFIGHPRGHGHPPEYAEYLVTLGWTTGQVEASAPTLALAICRGLLLAGREVRDA